MRFAVVSHHLPHPEGTATGRHVFAVWDAVRAAGHEVTAWAWGRAPGGLEPPEWVEVRPVDDPGGWRRLPATVRRPRWALADAGWTPPADAVCWAEEPESWAAVAATPWRAVTIPHSAVLDAVALREPRPAVLQSARAERRAARGTAVSVAMSARVAGATGARHVVPVALPLPASPLVPVADPVALLLADWSWPPNRAALLTLLAAWPRVRAELPAATLLVAGRGLTPDLLAGPAGRPDGIDVVGEVPRARDAMAAAAVLAFPCPATSGPKMKVLDALAHGLPVVTTRAGVEGLELTPGTVAVAAPGDGASALAAVLDDPARRAAMAALGRAAVAERHSPQRAAAERIRLAQALVQGSPGR